MHTSVTNELLTNNIVLALLQAKVSDQRFAPNGFPRPPLAILPAAPDAPLAIAAGGIEITSLLPGTPVQSGTTISLRAVGANGFVPTAMLFVTPLGSKMVEAPPFEVDFAIPTEAVGAIVVVAVGKDIAGKFSRSEPVTLPVEVSAKLTGISVSPNSFVFETFFSAEGFEVTGHYDDGIARDLTAAMTGTQYTASDTRIVSLDPDGLVTARRVGSTSITVSNSNFSIEVPITVSAAKGDTNSDGVVGPVDLQAFVACYSGASEAPDFKTLMLACAEVFDFDNDSDVDVEDLDALLDLYDGLIVDCNQNGETDLSEILAGSADDADQDGVPDECENRLLFHRGDPNVDDITNLTDAVLILNWLFLGKDAPKCLESADSNDDGVVNLTDAVVILNWLFLGGAAPAVPGPPQAGDCGTDRDGSPALLDCETYSGCG